MLSPRQGPYVNANPLANNAGDWARFAVASPSKRKRDWSQVCPLSHCPIKRDWSPVPASSREWSHFPAAASPRDWSQVPVAASLEEWTQVPAAASPREWVQGPAAVSPMDWPPDAAAASQKNWSQVSAAPSEWSRVSGGVSPGDWSSVPAAASPREWSKFSAASPKESWSPVSVFSPRDCSPVSPVSPTSPKDWSPIRTSASSGRQRQGVKNGAAASGDGHIRVIYIFSPKVIKTEVINFRALVQKLTGNSAEADDEVTIPKKSRSREAKTKRAADRFLPKFSFSQYHSCGYENAVKVFESSNRVEYIIPRPLQHSTPAAATDFKENIKPVRRAQSSYVSCCTQNTTTPVRNFVPEVSSRYCSANEGYCDNFKPGRIEQVAKPMIMVDPFQSLSGYRDKLQSSSPSPQRLSTIPMAFDDARTWMPTSKFSDMDIIMGLSSEPVTEAFSMPPAINSMPESFSFQTSGYPNNMCRLSAESPLRPGSASLQFENSSLCGFPVQYPLRGGASILENF